MATSLQFLSALRALHRGPGASPTATDQANLQQIVAGGVGAAADDRPPAMAAGRGQGRGGFEKIAPGGHCWRAWSAFRCHG